MGAPPVQAQSNYALQFDGTDDHVVVPDDERLRPSSITVEAWVNASAFPIWASVLTKTSSGSWEDGYGLAHYEGEGEQNITFYVDEWDQHNVTGILNDGWTHVAATYDGSTLRIYIDGELADSAPYGGGIQHSSNRLLLGRGEGGFDWEGVIDDVRIWNEARSQQQIQSNMDTPLTGTEEGLVGYWPFDQSAQDASGNGNDGTVNGASYVESTSPLPVELARFDGTQTDARDVRLRWKTLSETNNVGFRIQRKRADATGTANEWTTVGTVDGSGTTDQPQTYRFLDEEVSYATDRVLYRLKQVDADGTTTLSESITITFSTVDEPRLLGTYPNPARSETTVRYALPEGETGTATLRLYDVMGRQVRTVSLEAGAGRHTRSLRTDALSSGTYFLRLQADGHTKTQQFTVVR